MSFFPSSWFDCNASIGIGNDWRIKRKNKCIINSNCHLTLNFFSTNLRDLFICARENFHTTLTRQHTKQIKSLLLFANSICEDWKKKNK